MFSHVVLGSNDLQKSKKFYDAVFAAVGGGEGMQVSPERLIYNHDGGMLMITKPINGEPATYANGGTVGFNVPSQEGIDAWHDAGVANGGATCENPPGVRDMGDFKLYLAYMRDPDGNKLCAMLPLGQ